MTCSIEIDVDSVEAIHDQPGLPPSNIIVEGTAEDCTVVLVYLSNINATVQVEATVTNEGKWTAVFNAAENHFDPADFPCNLQDVKVHASCKDANSTCDPVVETIPILNCQIRDCPSQVSYIVYRGNNEQNLVDPSDCLEPGLYTVKIIDPLSNHIYYQWSLNNETQASDIGLFEYQIPLAYGDLPKPISGAIQIPAFVGCLLSMNVTLTVCEEPVPPLRCPETVSLEVTSLGGRPIDPDECLPSGQYVIRITEPVGDNIEYSWSVDNILQQDENTASFSYELPANEEHEIQVSVSQADCPAVPGSVSLNACEEQHPLDCPETVRLVVFNERRIPVQPADDCLPPGRYTIEVEDPVGAEFAYVWSVDGQVQVGEDENRFSYDLAEGGSVDVAVSVELEGCHPVPAGVKLVGCEEPPDCSQDSVELVVEDQGGNVVPTSAADCLEPGTYTVRVLTPSGDDVTYSWSVDSQVAEDELESDFTFDLTADASHLIQVSVTRSGCEPISGGVALRDCPESSSSIDFCLILRVFVLLGAGIALLGLALLACPLFAAPVLDPVVAAIIGGIMAAVGTVVFLISLLLWVVICRPNLCDWLILGWQIAAFATFIFFYIAFCPACLWLGGLGLLAFGLFIFLFVSWLQACRPNRCEIFQEFLFVMIHIDLIVLLEIIIGVCILTAIPLFAAVWALVILGFTFLAYWGMRHFCSINESTE